MKWIYAAAVGLAIVAVVAGNARWFLTAWAVALLGMGCLGVAQAIEEIQKEKR